MSNHMTIILCYLSFTGSLVIISLTACLIAAIIDKTQLRRWKDKKNKRAEFNKIIKEMIAFSESAMEASKVAKNCKWQIDRQIDKLLEKLPFITTQETKQITEKIRKYRELYSKIEKDIEEYNKEYSQRYKIFTEFCNKHNIKL